MPVFVVIRAQGTEKSIPCESVEKHPDFPATHIRLNGVIDSAIPGMKITTISVLATEVITILEGTLAENPVTPENPDPAGWVE